MSQYVLLGAGLDTFTQRRPEVASRMCVFEVDQPGHQAWKRQRLIELGSGIPDWLHLVPVDFEAGEDWWQGLAAAGFDTAKSALVASSGVSMYFKIFGLDQPLPQQYLAWIASLVSGDFGHSIRTSRPILPDVLARVPVTYQLAAMAMLLSLFLAVPLGVVASVTRSRGVDSLVRVVGLFGLSIPNFWLASMLILLVSQHFRGGLPTYGYVYPNQDLLGSFRSLLLPALALAAANMAILMRMTRSSMLEVLRHEYVLTARAKGLVERVVLYRHALRNALIPVVTVAGVQVGYLLGGAVIIEQIFALPGLGTLVLNGISQRDYPVVQAGMLFIAASFVVVNLAVDVLYAYLDPKIHYG